MSFKVGDKVKIVKLLNEDEFKVYNGKEGVIESFGFIPYPIKVRFKDNDYLHVNEDELELITPKSFTKNDFKEDMHVYFRDKTKHIVYEHKGNLFIIDPRGSITLEAYEDDLTYSEDKNADIIQVTFNGGVLWKREEKKLNYTYEKSNTGLWVLLYQGSWVCSFNKEENVKTVCDICNKDDEVR